jgi:hypothetical protein
MRRTVIVLGLLIGALALAGSAMAANHTTVTETDHIHGTFTEPEFTGNPCTGAGITSFQADGNVVDHVTYFLEDGQMTEVWATFTERGKVAITDDNGVSYSGHFTVWGNFNLNERNTNNTFTLTVRAGGSDGSSIVPHEVQHFALNANGVVTVDFDNMSLTAPTHAPVMLL